MNAHECQHAWVTDGFGPTKCYRCGEPALAAPKEAGDAFVRVCNALGIGSAAQTVECALTNIRNLQTFSRHLDAIEREFFMTPGEPDEDFPDDEPEPECLLNKWGSTTEQYVEQFRAALPRLAAPSKEAGAEDATYQRRVEATLARIPPNGKQKWRDRERQIDALTEIANGVWASKLDIPEAMSRVEAILNANPPGDQRQEGATVAESAQAIHAAAAAGKAPKAADVLKVFGDPRQSVSAPTQPASPPPEAAAAVDPVDGVFRTMPDGATFEDYRDQLARGGLTAVDQMGFDNVLHDHLAALASPTGPQPASADVVALNAEIAILQNNLEAQESCTARIGEHFDILNEKCAALHCLLVDVSRYLDPRQFPEVIGRIDTALAARDGGAKA